MLLDLNSFARAGQALPFFDRYINRYAAKATRLRIVNRFFSSTELVPDVPFYPSFDVFFNRDDVYIPDEADLGNKLIEIQNQYHNPDERHQKTIEYLDRLARVKSPQIEEIPITYYEDGIEPLYLALSLKHLEAREHWLGNTHYTQRDILDRYMNLDNADIFNASEE